MPTRADAKVDPRAFAAVLAAVNKDLLRRHHTQSLVEQMNRSGSLFFDYLRAERVRDLREVRDAHVTAYARHLAKAKSSRGTPFSVATQRWLLMCVKRLFRFLEEQGAILTNPTLDLELPSWRKLPRAVLAQEQARRLMAHPDPHTNRGKRSRAILELLYGAGIRVGECERLDLCDVNLAQGLVFIRDGKGRKDRVVPVVGRAAEALDFYLREARPALLVKNPHQEALFITRYGTRVRAKNIQYLVRMTSKAAEIPKPLSPHKLRHACATHLLKGGADIRHIQQLLGHASLESTAIYTRVAPVDLAKAIEKAHPREKAWRRKAKKAK